MAEERKESLNFIEQIIEEDIKAGRNNSKILTRLFSVLFLFLGGWICISYR